MNTIKHAAVALGLTTIATTSAFATENGQLRGLLGAPSYELTTPQFPGWYGQLWLQHYGADKLRDNDGNTPSQTVATPAGPAAVAVHGRINANVLVPRITWVTEKIIADGRLGFSATLPLVSQRNSIGATATFAPGTPAAVQAAVNQQLAQQSAALSGEQSGVADLDLAGFVDWAGDDGRVVVGASVVAPTGSYQAGRAVNPGAGNYWTVRPLVLLSRVWENGFELGMRATYSINTKNRDTDVRSGQYLHADWSAMYRVNDEWRVGLQGYVVQQFTKDSGPFVAAHGNKARTFAAGPMLSYVSESGVWAIDAKVLPEFSVRNRPQGTVSWLRLNIRLD